MLIIKNGYVIDPDSGYEGYRNVVIEGDKIKKICSDEELRVLQTDDDSSDADVIDATDKIVTAGLVDPHVHFRDPGYTYKEDICTGAKAAAHGGFTSVIMMGNTSPSMDSTDTISYALAKGKETDINIYACGNVTMNMSGKELTDMAKLSEAGAVLFTDDGKPIADTEVMTRACVEATRLDKIISLHEENPELITDNGINAGEVASKLGLVGSPRQAEISMVERDIEIARKTGARLTVQHISAAESVELIRQAKKEGLKIYAEATPHHFTLTEEAVLKHGTLAKMNPPLRLESDRMAIIEGISDGTIEMIATDHAPHSAEEKAVEFKNAPSGITGLETALSLGIRELVNKGYITMATLLNRMSTNAARLYGLDAGSVKEGATADLLIFDPKHEWVYEEVFSKAVNTPFLGERLPGVVCDTICRGKVIFRNQSYHL